MMRVVFLLVAASSTSAATAQTARKVIEIPWVPAPAQVASTSGIGKPASKEGAAMICAKREVPGSRINVNRECHTKAEWYYLSRLAQDDLDKRLRVPHLEQ